jgi:beta-glucosidase
MSRPAYRDAAVPVDVRIRDLLGRMTLEEKARQLDMYMGVEFVDRMRSATHMARDGRFDPERAARAVGTLGCGVIHDLCPPHADVANALQRWFRAETRLGIPPLLVEEALHGFSRPDATVFPQCIGLGATFDPELVRRIGAAIAAEMRSVGVHLSLSPVLCLARDPRWGRAEETFGEDPWLAGQMGQAYCAGMQGDLGPLNVVAEPKHFAGHGSPQAGLNQGPVHLGEREMREVMLRAFRPAFTEAGALGAMCAYHEIDGIPCAANPWLLTDVLRGEWGFGGVVISDLGAIRQLLDKHRVAADAEAAICLAIVAGVDIQFYDFDHGTWLQALVGAVAHGRLAPEILDRSVARVLALKFRLGLFDRPETDPDLHARVCRSEPHLALALEAARKSLVLLKNEGGLLPLPRGIRRLAVIGPSAATARLGDYSGIGDGHPATILGSLRALLPEADIRHAAGVDIDGVGLAPVPACWLRTPAGLPGLRGRYFAAGDLGGAATLERIDAAIDFNWAIALAAPGLPADGFAVRWDGTLVPDADLVGDIGFATSDAVRVWLADRLVIDRWDGQHGGPASATAPVRLRQGEAQSVCIEWRKCGGGSVVMLGHAARADGIQAAVEAAQGADVAILCLGESDRTSGEGIDRAELALPGRQGELFDAVAATGTPTVVVLQNGRPLAIADIAARADAILEAWYPGERGGQAVAEALLGMVNPGGRLPVTIPRHVGQIPNTYDRKPSHQGRYVEVAGAPLWPFGHGLGYAQFACGGLSLSAAEIAADEELEVSCMVTNVGACAGDEVIQLYLSDPVASVTRPVHWLAGCRRITLSPGQSERIVFRIGPRELEMWGRDRQWLVEPGEYGICVGGGQDGPRRATFHVGENGAQRPRT